MNAADLSELQALTAGIDHAASEAEAKWGVDRLPLLVSDDTRAKFIRQSKRWRDAVEVSWTAPVVTHADMEALRSASGGMRRAWAALDAEAFNAGHQPLAPQVWETTLRDGTVVAVVRSTAEAIHVNRDGRYVSVWTLAEVANVIDALSLMNAHNDDPPPSGPKVGLGRADYSWVEKGDEIPFG